MTYLPDDILYMVCAQLCHQRDFNTLFNCARSGRQLASIALMNLYRMHDVAPVTNGGSDEEIPTHDKLGKMSQAMRSSQEQRIFMKWAGLWRTIILSSLGKTLYPYSQYIRTLNLQDLEELLTEPKFRSRTIKYFFQGELAQFKVDVVAASNGHLRLDAMETINKIGEAITKETPLLEELNGKVLSGALSRWIPRLPRLTYLKTWHGAALEGNGNLIRLHCPSFKGLNFWSWDDDNSDQGLAAFLNELRPQSLESFETSSYPYIGPKSFQALSSHGESLSELKLNFLPAGTIPSVFLLKGCTNLVSLSLTGNGQAIDELEKSHNAAFLETVAWLKGCEKLQILTFTKFLSAPALMAPILLEDSIRLTSLEYEGLSKQDSSKFYQTLAHQTSLQSLCLKGDVDEYAAERTDAVVECLSKLINLTDLHLSQEVSEPFNDQHIMQLASSLPKLEVWLTGGYGLTDAIWDEVASLKSLRRLELSALTNFTGYGILKFIDKLGPGNKGLVLAVMNADVDSDLEQTEHDIIHEIITSKVEGRFEFTLSKDPDLSSFEGESD